jgi:hypothetical protein
MSHQGAAASLRNSTASNDRLPLRREDLLKLSRTMKTGENALSLPVVASGMENEDESRHEISPASAAGDSGRLADVRRPTGVPPFQGLNQRDPRTQGSGRSRTPSLHPGLTSFALPGRAPSGRKRSNPQTILANAAYQVPATIGTEFGPAGARPAGASRIEPRVITLGYRGRPNWFGP